MNLFRPPFRTGVFDVVIANSVLHHTSDPLRGFHALASLLKPDGLFVFSLYNPLWPGGQRFAPIVPSTFQRPAGFLRWRNENQRGRFIQRYKQPWESRHFLGEIAQDWFAAHEFEFLYCSPRIGSQASERRRRSSLRPLAGRPHHATQNRTRHDVARYCRRRIVCHDWP